MATQPPPKDNKAAAGDKRKYTDKLSEMIKENERRKEQRKFQEELAKRIQMARDGRYCYERKDLKNATIHYKKFLQLTARSLNVDVKDLHPRLFEERVRISEALVISAIVFDLAKIMDRVKNGTAERQLYLRLLVQFTVNMPFQFFIAENVNKYLKYTPNILNYGDFKAAYKAIGKGGFCFIATTCFGDAEAREVVILREWRNVLWKNPAGNLFVETYYLVSPGIARWLENKPRLKLLVRNQLKKFSEWLVRSGRIEI